MATSSNPNYAAGHPLPPTSLGVVEEQETQEIKNAQRSLEGEFNKLKMAHRQEDIGVVFCGAPAIATALKAACELHSDAVEGTLFRLHKENF